MDRVCDCGRNGCVNQKSAEHRRTAWGPNDNDHHHHQQQQQQQQPGDGEDVCDRQPSSRCHDDDTTMASHVTDKSAKEEKATSRWRRNRQVYGLTQAEQQRTKTKKRMSKPSPYDTHYRVISNDGAHDIDPTPYKAERSSRFRPCPRPYVDTYKRIWGIGDNDEPVVVSKSVGSEGSTYDRIFGIDKPKKMVSRASLPDTHCRLFGPNYATLFDRENDATSALKSEDVDRYQVQMNNKLADVEQWARSSTRGSVIASDKHPMSGKGEVMQIALWSTAHSSKPIESVSEVNDDDNDTSDDEDKSVVEVVEKTEELVSKTEEPLPTRLVAKTRKPKAPSCTERNPITGDGFGPLEDEVRMKLEGQLTKRREVY